jgi:hypothetical protein
MVARAFCAICTELLLPNHEQRRFYLPDEPDRIGRAHVFCIRRLQQAAASDEHSPVIVD